MKPHTKKVMGFEGHLVTKHICVDCGTYKNASYRTGSYVCEKCLDNTSDRLREKYGERIVELAPPTRNGGRKRVSHTKP